MFGSCTTLVKSPEESDHDRLRIDKDNGCHKRDSESHDLLSHHMWVTHCK